MIVLSKMGGVLVAAGLFVLVFAIFSSSSSLAAFSSPPQLPAHASNEYSNFVPATSNLSTDRVQYSSLNARLASTSGDSSSADLAHQIIKASLATKYETSGEIFHQLVIPDPLVQPIAVGNGGIQGLMSGLATSCPDDVLISNYQTSPSDQQFVEITNVGDADIDLDACTLVTYDALTELSIGVGTVGLNGTLASHDTFRIGSNSAGSVDLTIPAGALPGGPGGLAVLDAPPPADGTQVIDVLPDDITGMVYLNTNTVFGISHLREPSHNDIYDCVYGGHGRGPFTRPFTPVANCLVSTPVQVVVPDVVGEDQATAQSDIVAVNLVVGTVTGQNHASLPAGDVISQSPVGGSTVNAGSSVDLLVSLGPAAVADLSITKSDLFNNVAVGDPVFYSVTVTNNGPDNAQSVTVTDNLPAGATFISASPGCSESGGDVTCDLGDMANGAVVAVNVQISMSVTGQITNNVSVSPTLTDPDTSNNSASEVTNIVTSTAKTDLAVSITDTPDPVFSGNDVTYTVTITNNGPNTANNVSLTSRLTLPPGATLVSVTPASPSCSPVLPLVICNLGNLASSTSTNVTIVVTAGANGPISLSAGAISTVYEYPSDLADNNDTESTAVQ